MNYSYPKVGKLLDSTSFFRLISLSPASQSCCSASFYPVYFFSGVQFHSLSPPGRFPPRVVSFFIFFIFLSSFRMTNSVSPGSQKTLAAIDFSKVFGSVCLPSHSFSLAYSFGLLPYFVRWTQSFRSNRHARVIYQNYASRSSRVSRSVRHGSVLGPVLFFFFLSTISLSLPSFHQLLSLC